jgi:hypothetical protein
MSSLQLRVTPALQRRPFAASRARRTTPLPGGRAPRVGQAVVASGPQPREQRYRPPKMAAPGRERSLHAPDSGPADLTPGWICGRRAIPGRPGTTTGHSWTVGGGVCRNCRCARRPCEDRGSRSLRLRGLRFWKERSAACCADGGVSHDGQLWNCARQPPAVVLIELAMTWLTRNATGVYRWRYVGGGG